MIVVDSSIALQWVLPEFDNAAALGLLGRPDLVAPDILMVECANVLSKKVRAGEMRIEDARNGLAIIRDAVTTMVKSADIVDRALALSVELRHPVYDCCFFACALNSTDKLATRDQRFITRLIEQDYGDRLHFGATAT